MGSQKKPTKDFFPNAITEWYTKNNRKLAYTVLLINGDVERFSKGLVRFDNRPGDSQAFSFAFPIKVYFNLYIDISPPLYDDYGRNSI